MKAIKRILSALTGEPRRAQVDEWRRLGERSYRHAECDLRVSPNCAGLYECSTTNGRDVTFFAANLCRAKAEALRIADLPPTVDESDRRAYEARIAEEVANEVDDDEYGPIEPAFTVKIDDEGEIVAWARRPKSYCHFAAERSGRASSDVWRSLEAADKP